MNASSDLHTITRDKVYRGLARRYRKEKIFRLFGLISVLFGIACVAVLFTDIFSKGIGAFRQTWVKIEVVLNEETLGVPSAAPEELLSANFDGAIKKALQARFPDATERKDKKDLNALLSSAAADTLRNLLRSEPGKFNSKVSVWVLADDRTDTLFKHFNG